MAQAYNWKLKDIIMVGIISVIFGVIYLGAVHFGVLLGAALTPFGLSVLANEIIFGIWFMASIVAAYIIQKPGVAIVSEMLAALIEVFLGNFYGPIIFVSGFLQGLGAELGFAVFRYKRFDRVSIYLGAIGACILSFIWGFIRSGFVDLSPSLLVVMFIIRLVSSLVFAGLLVKLSGDRLAKSGVLKSYALGAKQELPVMER